MKIDDNEKDALFFLIGCATITLLLVISIIVIGLTIVKNLS